MRYKSNIVLITALLIIFASVCFAQKDPKLLTFPTLEFKPEIPESVMIKKGIELYCKEEHELPTINMFIIFRIGSLNDSEGKDGLASLTMRLLKSGGTENLTPDKLEEKLDFLGSSISSNTGLDFMVPLFSSDAGKEFSQIKLWTLTKNFEESWKILTDILFNPLFDKERFETEKKKDLEIIRRRWDYPWYVGEYLFNDLVYGKGFPDIRRTTTAGIESITIDDVKAFYEKNIKDAAITIAFSGDFKTSAITEIVKKTFKDWKGTPAETLDFPKARLASKPGLYIVDKQDMTQAVVCMGHLGINRLDPDNVEIRIMNFTCGRRTSGGVRTNRGLAYSVSGGVGAGRDLGSFFRACQTKSESVGEAIAVMKDIITDMTVKPVTPAELDAAKQSHQNRFVHRFDSAHAVLMEAIFYKMVGFPDDFLETYIPRLSKVDEDKVLKMAKRTMDPNNLIILVVGKKAKILDQLKSLNLGEVKEIPHPIE